MNRPNTPRPFTYVSPPEEEFVLHEDPPPTPLSSSSAAAYVPPPIRIRNRIIPIGTTAIPTGRPEIIIPNNSLIPENKKPRLLTIIPPRPAATLPTIPIYPEPKYYATRQTIMNHIERLPTTARYMATVNPDFRNNIFYPKPNTPNNGSYFHPGYTVDQIRKMEEDRHKEWMATYYKGKSGGRRSSKYHTRHLKKRKRKTRRRA